VDTSQLIGKIERLRAAIGEAKDPDLTKIKATVTHTADMGRSQHRSAGDV